MADTPFGGGVKLEGDDIVIRIPRDEGHGFCVALAECPCRATKSAATAAIRLSVKKAVAKAIAPKSVQRPALHSEEV